MWFWPTQRRSRQKTKSARQAVADDFQAVVTTLAGTGEPGWADGSGTEAAFSAPFALSLHGDALLVADLQNHRIRRMLLTPTHNVSTVAGSGRPALQDGVGTSASFNRPAAMANDGAVLYVADRYNHAIRSVQLATFSVATLAGSGAPELADGIGGAARFNCPTGLALAGDHAVLFVADQLNNAVRRVEVASGAVTTLRPAPGGAFNRPTGLDIRCAAAPEADAPPSAACEPAMLLVADQWQNRVATLELSTGQVTALAGGAAAGASDGWGAAAAFHMPTGVALRGHSALVADRNNGLLRAVDLATGRTTTLAGSARVTALLDGVGRRRLSQVAVYPA